ncbi:MAG: ABC transporter ATP-binding protein [Mogibacterium sp.]|nr:ABC transporter ATP-binding protein [Mogibacterium sp.]
MIKTLFRFFKPHRKYFILDMFCAVTVAAIDLAFPLVSRHAMYDMLPDKLYGPFFALMFSMAFFYVLRSVGQFLMTYIGHLFGVLVEADIRSALFSHLQDLDFEFYDKNRTGKLMSRLTGDLFEITELAHHGPEDLLISTLTIIGSLSFMFYMEWRLASVVAILLPIFVIVVMKRRRSMGEASVEVKRKLAGINADIETSLSGMKTSKAFANEEVEHDRFTHSNDSYIEARRIYFRAMGRFFATQEFFMGIMPAVVITFGGFLIMKERLNYIDLITFTLFVNTFVSPIRKLAQFAEVFANGMAGLKRFNEIMEMKPVVVEKPDAKPIVVTEGNIDVNDISFSYEENTEVIEHLDLHVKAGEKVAVVGPSGGGKSTLCQLIPRFYDVTDGSIFIDGQDIRDVTKTSLRENIGIVQQDVFIFAETILENIRYGRPGATYDEVVEAAKRAEIYDDIMEMPDQFNTYVGERGTKLSGGQKQRLSIARIFLKDPKILILDEATSALDTVTEQRIQSSFDQLAEGRTSLVIAHRLATVKNADRIIVIEDGRITESGTHEELLAAGGEYSKLYNTQKLSA